MKTITLSFRSENLLLLNLMAIIGGTTENKICQSVVNKYIDTVRLELNPVVDVIKSTSLNGHQKNDFWSDSDLYLRMESTTSSWISAQNNYGDFITNQELMKVFDLTDGYTMGRIMKQLGFRQTIKKIHNKTTRGYWITRPDSSQGYTTPLPL